MYLVGLNSVDSWALGTAEAFVHPAETGLDVVAERTGLLGLEGGWDYAAACCDAAAENYTDHLGLCLSFEAACPKGSCTSFDCDRDYREYSMGTDAFSCCLVRTWNDSQDSPTPWTLFVSIGAGEHLAEGAAESASETAAGREVALDSY